MAQRVLDAPAITAKHTLRRGPLSRGRRAFISRNARLDTEAVAVERSIAGRAISSMIQHGGSGDILRLTATRDGVDFNRAYIGEDFAVQLKDIVDPAHMRALSGHGYRLAAAGHPRDKGHPRVLAQVARR